MKVAYLTVGLLVTSNWYVSSWSRLKNEMDDEPCVLKLIVVGFEVDGSWLLVLKLIVVGFEVDCSLLKS